MSKPGGSGAGAFPAGIGPAGWDPLEAPLERTIGKLVSAPLFDPESRTYPTNEDGSLQVENPVMHRVRHLLGIRRRALSSAPTTGMPIAELREARPDQRQRAAEDAVLRALKPLIDAGDVRVDRVVLSSPWDGTFYPEITNLRAPTSASERLTVRLSRED